MAKNATAAQAAAPIATAAQAVEPIATAAQAVEPIATAAKTEETVTFVLPLKMDGSDESEYYSLNGMNKRVRRGVSVTVPKALYNHIMECETARAKAYQIALSKKLREPKQN